VVRWTRREFVAGSLAGTLSALSWPLPLHAKGLAPSVVSELEKSPLVYISPLLASGKESTCHGELWFAWLDGSVVVTVATDRWKSQAVAKGLDKARIWVGDHGRWKGLLFNNDAFRKSPSFEARAQLVRDAPQLVERLLSVYDEKYPAEIAAWRDKMKQGNADGSRVLIRYTPVEV